MFVKDVQATLTSAFRKKRRTHDARRKVIVALSVHPELVKGYFDGPITARALLHTVEQNGHAWTNLTPKSFGEFLNKTFKDMEGSAS